MGFKYNERYDIERSWNSGGKNWTYEYKYRRGGKTLYSLYARNNCVGFMIIFGKDERTKFEESRESFSAEVQKIYKDERTKFEESRESFSAEVQKIYDESKTYHDGKWVMFYPGDESLFSDFMRLLAIKRKPNKNQ